jgi:hypothetical protein
MVRPNDPFWNDVEDMNDGSVGLLPLCAAIIEHLQPIF